MLDSNIILNKSKTYLLYYFAETLGIKHFELLLNTYLFYEGENKVCFLYKYSSSLEFGEYERKIEQNKHHFKTIDVSADKVLFVMNIPEGLDDPIDLFMLGKYSSLPKRKNLIKFLKSEFGATEKSKIIRIIKKDIILKKEIEELLNNPIYDLDLSSSPDFDAENFTSNLYEKESEYDDFGKTDRLQDQDPSIWDS